MRLDQQEELAYVVAKARCHLIAYRAVVGWELAGTGSAEAVR